MHLGNAVIEHILRREIGRTSYSSPKERRRRLSSVGDNMLQNRTSTRRFAPDGNFARVASKLGNLRNELEDRKVIMEECD
jgi:hypothetical protein